MTKVNKVERIKMVKAMEFIARQVNNEDVFEEWLILGVADGDIEYGDLTINKDLDEEEAAWYVDDDKQFAALMETFLSVMVGAKEDGGLYCDNVVSAEEES